MGKLTTHVLDTSKGKPGSGIAVQLFGIDDQGQERRLLLSTTTNSDGRCDAPLLEGDTFRQGIYELQFAAGDYFSQDQTLPEKKLAEPAFVDIVVLRFGISDASQHYHVPLLVSPFSYSTYRGS